MGSPCQKRRSVAVDLAEYVTALVAAAPPLTEEQLGKLAAIMGPQFEHAPKNTRRTAQSMTSERGARYFTDEAA